MRNPATLSSAAIDFISDLTLISSIVCAFPATRPKLGSFVQFSLRAEGREGLRSTLSTRRFPFCSANLLA
jgi:hypothetical protein